MRSAIQNSCIGAQRGAALFVSLIALVFMLLGGLALLRSVDTSNLIAGNFAFKQASLQASDRGLESAFALLNSPSGSVPPPPILPNFATAVYPAACQTAAPTTCQYFPTRQAVDAAGIPTPIGNWSGVPSTDLGNGYTHQFVIDRLCTVATPTNIPNECIAGALPGGGSKKAPASGVALSGVTEIYYRATIRITGPRGTQTIVQTLFAR